MTEDILERAKAAIAEAQSCGHTRYEELSSNALDELLPDAITEVERLQDLIDSPPEEADWLHDDARLCGEITTGVVQIARKWHSAYRKVQNSNLMRAKEVERLRAALAHELDLRNRHIESLEARIKELEATKERLQSAPKSGLYGKYIIQKADGSPVDPEADYFILRLDADPVARIAALEYAIQTDDQKLGEMLEKRVMDHVFSKDDQCRKRVEGWPIGQIKQLRKQIASKDARIKAREAEITAWVADRDSWIGRYEAVRKEKDARIADQEAYIERLEAAFLESEAENQFHQNYGESEWAIHPEEDFEGHWGRNRFRSEAREALERIKSNEKL